MTHSYAWYDLLVCLKLTRSYAWHDLFVRVTITHWCVTCHRCVTSCRFESQALVNAFISGVTYSDVCHDLFTRVTITHRCVTSHRCVTPCRSLESQAPICSIHKWRDLFGCVPWLVPWLIRVSDMTHLHVWQWLIRTCHMTYSFVSHDSFVCVAWLIPLWDTTNFECVTWLIQMLCMTHWYV